MASIGLVYELFRTTDHQHFIPLFHNHIYGAYLLITPKHSIMAQTRNIHAADTNSWRVRLVNRARLHPARRTEALLLCFICQSKQLGGQRMHDQPTEDQETMISTNNINHYNLPQKVQASFSASAP
jgi:hypothetical protein